MAKSEAQVASIEPTGKKVRKAPKRRPVYLAGVRAFDANGREFEGVASLEFELMSRDTSKVLEYVADHPGTTFIKVDTNVA